MSITIGLLGADDVKNRKKMKGYLKEYDPNCEFVVFTSNCFNPRLLGTQWFVMAKGHATSDEFSKFVKDDCFRVIYSDIDKNSMKRFMKALEVGRKVNPPRFDSFESASFNDLRPRIVDGIKDCLDNVILSDIFSDGYLTGKDGGSLRAWTDLRYILSHWYALDDGTGVWESVSDCLKVLCSVCYGSTPKSKLDKCFGKLKSLVEKEVDNACTSFS